MLRQVFAIPGGIVARGPIETAAMKPHHDRKSIGPFFGRRINIYVKTVFTHPRFGNIAVQGGSWKFLGGHKAELGAFPDSCPGCNGLRWLPTVISQRRSGIRNPSINTNLFPYISNQCPGNVSCICQYRINDLNAFVPNA